MSFDESLQADPNGAGNDAGSLETDPGTQAPAAPAVRTYSDADMAGLRRSQQAEWDRREARLRAEFEERYTPKPVTVPVDPWSDPAVIDPSVAKTLRGLLEHEFSQRLAPFQQRQEDAELQNDEARLSSKYADYSRVRLDVLEFAVQNNIANLEQAYRAFKYDELSKIDVKAIGQKAISDYQKKKAAQAAGVPSVEGRGGGTPSSKQNFKNRDEMDQAAEALVRQANENSA